MPSETTARAGPLSDVPTEGDYRAFCEALSASARGRAFLAEYARRNRNADTTQLLTAIDSLQALISARTTQTSAPVRDELHALLDEIGSAQRDLEEGVAAIRATKLTELAALVERRISKILASLHGEPAQEAPLVSSPVAESPKEFERAHLAVVPLPEQPELPIPSPKASQPPPIALVRSEATIAQVASVELPPEPFVPSVKDVSDTVSVRAGEPQPPPAVATATAKNPPTSTDPLASISALTEDERLALFT